jgi:hypothetical protein
VRELEKILEYARASLRARDAWDELIASEVPAPRHSLYVELRAASEVHAGMTRAKRCIHPSLLDQLLMTAEAQHLGLPEYAILAAFRLRQRLSGIY